MAQRKGRRKGSTNLKRTSSGNLVNKHGVTFTPEEKRAMTNAVRAANRKAAKMKAETDQIPRRVGGKDTGQKLGELRLMNREENFTLQKRSMSLNRIKSRSQFEKYMKELDYINDDPQAYVEDKIRGYKRNFTKALRENFGDEAKDIEMKIRMMKPQQYMELVESNDELRIEYVYPDKDGASWKLEEMRAALGMPSKEE